jgi:predicted lactoylglutathione lyase
MELKTLHICLEISNFSKSLEFYRPLLRATGFVEAWGDKSSYAGFKNGIITVVIGESKPRRVTRQAPTGEELAVSDHVGFSVGRREDVDAIAQAMAAAGFKPLFPAQEYPEFGHGFYAVTFCDSDNNVIEFGHYTYPV